MERGIDIAHWWRRSRREDGTLILSSRRLHLLVFKLPPESAFMQEWRMQDWSLKQYLEAAAVNELRIMRAEMAVFNGNDFREPILVKSPAQQDAADMDSHEKDLIRQGIQAQLNRKLKKKR